MSEEARDVGVLDSGRPGLAWDRIFDRVRDHLATVPDRNRVVTYGPPKWLLASINQTRGILGAIELASWEDHIEDMVRPQLEKLLAVLETARREYQPEGSKE